MMLRVENLSFNIQNNQILKDISLEVTTGEFVGLIGPNGSGKSSLLRCIYRVYKPDRGRVILNNQNIWEISTREMAQKTAVVLQEANSEFNFTVEEVVAMGRTPHQDIFEQETIKDRAIIEDALIQVGIEKFKQRNFNSLSGGEKQRVLVARAITQQPQLLILDEATNHLDIRYQLEILELVKKLNITCIAALHDLNLAAAYCSRIIVLYSGSIVAEGFPESVLNPHLIRQVYNVESEIRIHPHTGKLQIYFFPIHS
ncbi:MAG: ABC transporter ATP-binding protein [Calothrix sp. CSU_2_0]|nr:ABC transporter ATP-binding protein [Calothrix sp. CSU_2_0]